MESSQNDGTSAERTAQEKASASSSDGAQQGSESAPTDCQQAIAQARMHLLRLQYADGCWCGELLGHAILESEFVILLAWLGELDREIVSQLAGHVARQQLRQGGWSLYPGGEIDIDVSVKAYFAMKLAGHDPRSEPMRLAREAILDHGGADAVGSFTRFYLALLGQIPFECCVAVMPEIVLLPRWSPLNIYRLSAWSRAILVPLSVVWACRPSRPIPPELGIAELVVKPPHRWPSVRDSAATPSPGWVNWERLFHALDGAARGFERVRLRPLRAIALRAAKQWMTDRFVDSDGLAAMFRPILWSRIALSCLGYDDQSAEVRYCHEQLEDLVVTQDDQVRVQPCKSPVGDTAWTVRALTATAETEEEGAVARATQWLLSREATRAGDWSTRVRTEPGGWFFQHHNGLYPDLNHTAVVLTALRERFVKEPGPSGGHRGQPMARRLVFLTTTPTVPEARERALLIDGAMDACDRARSWVRAMQNADGGWGTFDRDNDAAYLRRMPFDERCAILDPSSPDVTGRVLEALGVWGARSDDPAVSRGIRYLRATQEPDGSWPGRWGVHYIYGTWQCLVGLRAAGVDRDDPCLQLGTAWLIEHQQESGGWGELPESYTQPARRGQGPATASQTAWALLALMACDLYRHPAVLRGIAYLMRSQRPDGAWDEPEFTGTGLPGAFYLRYQLFPLYFPLLALGRYEQTCRTSRP